MKSVDPFVQKRDKVISLYGKSRRAFGVCLALLIGSRGFSDVLWVSTTVMLLFGVSYFTQEYLRFRSLKLRDEVILNRLEKGRSDLDETDQETIEEIQVKQKLFAAQSYISRMAFAYICAVVIPLIGIIFAYAWSNAPHPPGIFGYLTVLMITLSVTSFLFLDQFIDNRFSSGEKQILARLSKS